MTATKLHAITLSPLCEPEHVHILFRRNGSQQTEYARVACPGARKASGAMDWDKVLAAVDVATAPKEVE